MPKQIPVLTWEQCPPSATCSRVARQTNVLPASKAPLWTEHRQPPEGPACPPHGLAYLYWCLQGHSPFDNHDSQNRSTRAHWWFPEDSSSSRAGHMWPEMRWMKVTLFIHQILSFINVIWACSIINLILQIRELIFGAIVLYPSQCRAAIQNQFFLANVLPCYCCYITI